MTSSEYWAERFRQLTETQIRSDEELVKEFEKLYKQAQTEIESKISRWYMKFAENNEISMADAKKLLKADELEEFRWTVEEYIKHGEENIDDVFTKQLVNASSKVHISRYEALLTELRQTAEKIMGTQASKLTEHLKTAYSENYLHTAFEIQKGTGVGTYIGGVDERSLSEVIKKPWAVDGNNFSERIWKDRNSLVSELDTQLKRNIALGKGPDEAAKAIAKRFETSKSNAYRLVMTESAAISARATKQCYDDLDVDEFEVLETLDKHTCEVCGAMDGKHFPKSQYEIGVTVPPFHPRCRGTTVPYFDDMEGIGERAARDLDGSTFYVPADTTYEQWKQIQISNGMNSFNEKQEEFNRRKIGEQGQEIIDKSTYQKLTRKFIKNGGMIIRGVDAEKHLGERAYASYLPGFNAAFIRDDATVSDVLEEMYHAEQDRTHMYGDVLTDEVRLRREIDAQKYLTRVANKYKIPVEEQEVTLQNLADYERQLKELLEV